MQMEPSWRLDGRAVLTVSYAIPVYVRKRPESLAGARTRDPLAQHIDAANEREVAAILCAPRQEFDVADLASGAVAG